MSIVSRLKAERASFSSKMSLNREMPNAYMVVSIRLPQPIPG